jgi:hypothetical protein
MNKQNVYHLVDMEYYWDGIVLKNKNTEAGVA